LWSVLCTLDFLARRIKVFEGTTMQYPVYDLPRIPLLLGSVNRGSRAGRSRLMLSLQQRYLAKIRAVVGIEQVPRGEGAGLVAPRSYGL